MLAHLRHRAILGQLRQQGSVSVTGLAQHFTVSEMTIRRDLLELESAGHLARIHGGAVASHGLTIDATEPDFDSRLRHKRAAKEAAAAAACGLIAPQTRTVAIDVGATLFLLAGHLRNRPGLSVFTNSLRAATSLAEAGQEVFVPGGRVRGNEMAIVGAGAAQAFEKLWFDIAFIGASGLTAEGFFDYSVEDTEIKQVYLRRAARKILVCDASKFQRMSLVHVADFSAIDALVTDAPPPPPIAAALHAASVAVHMADETEHHKAGDVE
jgi:DeoR family glycerol-3-phosphate regulon repressor